MSLRQRNKFLFINISITVTCWAIVMLLLFPSCSSKKEKLGEAILERDSLPGMRTLGVNTLVSDSGITRYRVKAEEWLIFDKKNPPYWAFEKGIYLEKFDSLYRVSANIKADTAYYYEREKLWELRGHVKIQNLQGDKITTSLFFWNQNTQKIYSNKHTVIEQIDKTRLVGQNGFESNQEMTQYTIYDNEGIFFIDDTPNDSIKSDSIK
ncbi:MAG: LPS export ABC transporter periplasmic protein LptC [Bacteroides sp.]